MRQEKTPASGEDIPITPLFMTLFGVFTFVYGILLIPITSGALPYDGDAARALFLVVFAIMIAFLGVTPVGTFRHSWPLFFVGLALSLLGTLSFLAPGAFGPAASVALGTILVVMGFVRMPFYLVRKSQEFSKLPSVYTVFYYLMHMLCVIIGLGILISDAFPRLMSAVLLIALGVTQLILGFTSMRIEREHPGTVPSATRLDSVEADEASVDIPLKNMIMLLLGIMMVLMAIVWFLGALNIVPVDGETVNALFLFITAMQVMLVGDTPVKSFGPSWPLVVLGIVLAALSMVAAIVPGVLDSALGTAMGCVNLASAIVGCVRMGRLFHDAAGHRSRLLVNIILTGLVLYLLLFVFAVNLFLPGAVPGLLMLFVLLLCGIMMIRLVFLSRKMESIAGDRAAA